MPTYKIAILTIHDAPSADEAQTEIEETQSRYETPSQVIVGETWAEVTEKLVATNPPAGL